MKLILKGDPSILKQIPDLSEDDYTLFYIQAALCWDLYGLPDGTKNPEHLNPEAGGHSTRAPSPEEFNFSLNKILNKVLLKNEKWLIKIPRGLAKLHSLDAKALVTSKGGAAIIFPLGAMGGLFIANELMYLLRSKENKDLKSLSKKSHKLIVSNLPAYLAYWLLCIDGAPNIHDLELELWGLRWGRELAWSLHDHEKSGAVQTFIWFTTVIQQLFILLHELGHLLHASSKNLRKTSNNLMKLSFAGNKDEINADKWASTRLYQYYLNDIKRDDFTPQDYHQAVVGELIGKALLTLLGQIYLLSQTGYLSTDAKFIVERAHSLKKQLMPHLRLGPKTIEKSFKNFEGFFIDNWDYFGITEDL